ncbi:hypothetical protein BB560_005890 [Smittium megazygosporum]|uniref:Uncharacterized protein n=1 Tax=Smittium megazygosporum TaxID=133381 RepID=A0A2T9YRW0_9FUNG|nr:hypothetical protein BB560_005890 [Smittium megazygosporum]
MSESNTIAAAERIRAPKGPRLPRTGNVDSSGLSTSSDNSTETINTPQPLPPFQQNPPSKLDTEFTSSPTHSSPEPDSNISTPPTYDLPPTPGSILNSDVSTPFPSISNVATDNLVGSFPSTKAVQHHSPNFNSMFSSIDTSFTLNQVTPSFMQEPTASQAENLTITPPPSTPLSPEADPSLSQTSEPANIGLEGLHIDSPPPSAPIPEEGDFLEDSHTSTKSSLKGNPRSVSPDVPPSILKKTVETQIQASIIANSSSPESETTHHSILKSNADFISEDSGFFSSGNLNDHQDASRGYDSDGTQKPFSNTPPLRKPTFGSGTDITTQSAIFRQSTFSMSTSSLSRASMNFGSNQNRISRTLLDSKPALEMYRDAALKTNDERIQLEYAKFLLDSIKTLENGQSFSLSNSFRPMSVADFMFNSNPMSRSGSGHSIHSSNSSQSNINSVADVRFDDKSQSQDNGDDPNGQSANNKNKLVKEAFYWLNLLQKKGSAEACYILGTWYESGLYGVSVDKTKSQRLYVQAAKLHHSKAAFKVAEAYESKKQNSKAFSYYSVAAAMADCPSNYRLATALLKGELGQRQDIKKALIFLRRAAELACVECPDGAHVLGIIYLGEYPDKRVNDIIFTDYEEAHKQLERAASLGMPEAQHKLGHLFEFGEYGFPADPYTSIAYYNTSANQGFALSQMALSGWYLSGAKGILEQSDTLAYDWCLRAANQGLPRAQFGMGYYYDIGIGVERDLQKAIEWYEKAAASGSAEAKERLQKVRNQLAAEDTAESKKSLRRNVTVSRNKKKQSINKQPKSENKEMCSIM